MGGGFSRERILFLRQDDYRMFGFEQVRAWLPRRCSLLRSDLVATGQQGGERFVSFRGSRHATPEEQPAAERLRRAHPLGAVELDAAHPDIEREQDNGEF